jgi:hypothetical protein
MEALTMAIFDQGYALVVGVGADLPDTIQDAEGLAGVLRDSQRCAYPPDQVVLLTGERATRQHILDSMDTLAQVAQPDSTAVVYFSGHGYRVGSPTGEFYYLMPYGYSVNALYRTAVSGAEFAAKLQAIRARRMLVLLDCCHAGGVGDAKAPGLDMAKSSLPPEAQALFAEGSGRVLIASSREDELSFAGKPYSAFTQALIGALCGEGVSKKDGYVRVADLAMYAREVVPGMTNSRQHPVLNFEQADNFALAYYAAGQTEPKGTPFTEPPQIEPEPGAWAGFSQQGQVMHGPQTNIAGDVDGPVFSGQFQGPVATDGGDAVDMRGAQGAVYKPSGPVSQQFGDQYNVTGDGNVIGDGSSSRVVKTHIAGPVEGSTIITGENILIGMRPGEELDIAPSPQARQLHRILRSRLGLEEFRTLCFDLGVRYDDLGGEGLSGKARQLVLHLQQREALSVIVDWLRMERPDIAI